MEKRRLSRAVHLLHLSPLLRFFLPCGGQQATELFFLTVDRTHRKNSKQNFGVDARFEFFLPQWTARINFFSSGGPHASIFFFAVDRTHRFFFCSGQYASIFFYSGPHASIFFLIVDRTHPKKNFSGGPHASKIFFGGGPRASNLKNGV